MMNEKEVDYPNGYLTYLLNRLTPGTALDVGCGQGRHVLPLLERKWDVTALDCNQQHLSRMCEKARNSPQLHANTLDLHTQLPTEPSDLVICSFVLHYFPLKRALEIIQALKECVKPQGHLLLVTWGEEGELYEVAKMEKRDMFFADEPLLNAALASLRLVEPITKRTICTTENQTGRLIKNAALRGLWQRP